MKKPAVQVEKYGVKVWQNKEMDELRKDECLCLNCDHIKECDTATAGYKLCVSDNIAFMVTRCPNYSHITMKI